MDEKGAMSAKIPRSTYRYLLPIYYTYIFLSIYTHQNKLISLVEMSNASIERTDKNAFELEWS